MNLKIIDSIGPFILKDKTNHNWSKTPFGYYDKLNNPKSEFEIVLKNFMKYVKKISKIGYNAITIDDLSHMAILDIYPYKLKEKLNKFKELYSKLIKICNDKKIKVFINFDLMYFNNEIERLCKNNTNNMIIILNKSLKYLFNNYNVDGIISRFGECDGVDVKGIFKSKIIIKTPNIAKKFLNNLLPVIEKFNKSWIFRTWSISGSKIGDLMWNKKTFDKIFNKIKSDNLIISMKYGESDFFRNMELNPLFFHSKHKKIIELQTKREYDFFGEMPYYTGFQYQKYYEKLKNNKTFDGMMVWCQTGGWHFSHRVTFLENSSKFVELNTISTLKIFEGKDPEKCIFDYFKDKNYIQFFKEYNRLSNKILYPNNNKRIYFKRLHIPPLLWIFWNNVVINKFMISFVKFLYKDCPKISYDEFNKLLELGKKCNVNKNEFYIDTLKILYLTRKVLHGKYNKYFFCKKVLSYNNKYQFLNFHIKNTKASKTFSIILRLAFRRKKNYRMVDKILLNKYILLLFYKIYLILNKKNLPYFVNNQAMPLSKLI